MRAILVALILASAAGRVSAGDHEVSPAACGAPGPAEAGVRACTALIDAGQLKGDALSDVYYHRAWAYRRARQIDPAIADFLQAIALTEDFGRLFILYVDLAQAYEVKGLYDQAVDNFSLALEIAPDSPFVYYFRAEDYRKMGRRDEAIADYRAALKLRPSLTAARDGLISLGATP